MNTSADIIRSPGKFQGEPSWVAEYYERVMNGDYDELDERTDRFTFILEDEDFGMYPALVGFTKLYIWEDSQGFVRHELSKGGTD